MGDSADDADRAAECRDTVRGLREMLQHTDTGHVVWTARDGKKTKLKDFGLKRLVAIEGHLKRSIDKGDNKDWLKLIQNEIKNRN